jgi:hypothetical protein
MMIPERPALERRVLDALDLNANAPLTAAGGPATEGAPAVGRRIPVLLGGCGTGRTSLLLRLRDLLGRNSTQYVDVERIATTPERFLRALRQSSPFPTQGVPGGTGADHPPRESFGAALAVLSEARGTTGGPVTFLLDEFLELRTFESFPGLRAVLRELIAALDASGNRFVLTSRYTARAQRLLRDAPARFEILHVAPLGAAEVRATLPAGDERGPASFKPASFKPASFKDVEEDHARDELARLVQVLSDGRPLYARLIAEAAVAMASRGGADPVSALCALLAPGGSLTAACRYSYELRLHRARGYGALKAILDVLAEEEPLTLTEIALRLRRTPGSTKDYLSWLEDVDLIGARQKRYRFVDPLLRVWVRLHCRAVPPPEEDIATEVHSYVMSRLPHAEPALALSGAPRAAGPEKNWGIIEID